MKQNSKSIAFIQKLTEKVYQPETLSLTRYLKIPEKSDQTKNIQILLGNRAQKIEEFYKQLSAFSNNETTEREKLEIIFRQFDESKMDQQKSVANEVLASGQLRLKKSTVKNIGILLILHIIPARNMEHV